MEQSVLAWNALQHEFVGHVYLESFRIGLGWENLFQQKSFKHVSMGLWLLMSGRGESDMSCNFLQHDSLDLCF